MQPIKLLNYGIYPRTNRAVKRKALNSKGTFTITTKQLFEECGYIPVHILQNKEEFEDEEEFEPSEVELLD